ncbi:glycosyltransferase family 4 protein [Chryseobacterium sp. MMS23-Vi53]|uniref:glycosyltransferase family 4 protein n=1 Tax=Chryseobacterium sp. MMS23-Vi53 TaxID=3386644 RepID=UPI0039E9ED90
MRVLFLTKYSEKGASSRYRFYNYKKYLEENNITPSYKPLFGDSYLKYLYKGNTIIKNLLAIYFVIKRIFFLAFNIKRYDHVVIEAELFPHFDYKFDYFFLKKIKSFSLDFDDNISANYQNTSRKDKIPQLIKMANFVTVGNHWYFSEFKGNLIYLPTVIDLDQYSQHNVQEKDEMPSVVWIGSPSTQKYLLLIEKSLVNISDKFNFKLKIIGGNISLDRKINVEYIQWDSKTENLNLAKSDIGIMPLEKTFWENGKCGFKLIQYMASGIAVIASDLQANKEIVENNVSGFIVSSLPQWEKKIYELLQNKELRYSMGVAGRKTVEERYSYQVWGKKYADIIKNNK